MPNEIAIYYSKRKTLINILWLSIIPGFAFFLILKSDRQDVWIFLIISTILFGALVVLNLYQLLSRKPALIISKRGIKAGNHELISWIDIRDERIEVEYGSKGGLHYYLRFDHNGKQINFIIDDLKIKKSLLEDILVDYRNFSGAN